MYSVTFCLAQNCFTFFFLKFRLNIILFERMYNMKDFDDVTLAREDKELNDDDVSTIGGLVLDVTKNTKRWSKYY